MTRFWLTLDQGVDFVLTCLKVMQGGEIFVPKIPSMNIMDLAEAVAPGCRSDFIGIRPGEKLHEVLISEEEAYHTLDVGDMYIVRPLYAWWQTKNWSEGNPLPDGFHYSSNNNDKWLSVNELRALLAESGFMETEEVGGK
jgi:UDP-N-acetylglucosamine 4,6-dehydratase